MTTFEKNDTFAKVVAIVAQELKIEANTIKNNSTFADLGADSLDMVQIVMQLEEKFGIEVNDADAENMHVLDDVVDYVQARRTK